ncbi:oligouridylate-binding protein 1 [Physcia stellaris]|nr:oligouridylate-binding protein 1 [Physcia stellaris]
MSAIDQIIKPTNKKPSKQNIRPCDPSQLVDVHLPPAVPLQSFSQKLLAACSALYSRNSRESNSPSPTLPPVRPLRVLEPRPVSPDDGNEFRAEVESLGAAQAEHEHEHQISDTLYDQEKLTDSQSKLEVGAGELDDPKGKTEAAERREMEEWDRTVWERWFADEERRRTVEREGERYRPRMRKGRQLPTIREQIEDGPIGDVDKGDDTYADVDSIDILEALSQSRPSSSHGLLTDALSSTDAKTPGPQPAVQSSSSRPPSLNGDLITTAYHQTIQKNGITAICADSNQSEIARIPLTEPRVTTCRDSVGTSLFRAGTDREDIEYDNEVSGTVLKLRGGGDRADRRKSDRFADNERVPRVMWYFAGGTGPPPTGKQLRERKAKREAYVQRKREGEEAKKAGKEAARELKKAGVKIEGEGNGRRDASFGGWGKIFGQKKKSKTRGNEENKDKEGEKPEDDDAGSQGA